MEIEGMIQCVYLRKTEACVSTNHCNYKQLDKSGAIICRLKGAIGETDKQSRNHWDKP